MTILLREEQRIPEGKWTHWLICAGRGFGKTFTGAYWVNYLVNNWNYKKVGLIGHTIIEARNIMIEGSSGLMFFNSKLHMYAYKKMVIWPNGAIGIYFGGEFYNKLRGYEFDLIWIDEFAKIKNGSQLMEQIYFCLRKKGNLSRIIITTTPQNTESMKKLFAIPNIVITNGSSYDNKDNLSSDFIQNIQQYENTSFGNQEIHGLLIDNSNLWTLEDIVYFS